MKYEAKFRLRKKSILPAKTGGRKAWKELKSNMKKKRGKEVTKLYNTRKGDKVPYGFNKHYRLKSLES